MKEHPGEVIPSKFHATHSVGELALLVPEQQALSVDTKSTKAKVFGRLMVLMQDDNDVQIIVNQEDQIPNVMAHLHKDGYIIDFTVVITASATLLYLLYKESISVVDVTDLLAKKGNAVVVEQISLKDYGQYYRVDAA